MTTQEDLVLDADSPAGIGLREPVTAAQAAPFVSRGALTGSVAWVTGAGSGIGRATAIALAQSGALVALTGRRIEALQETDEAIRAAGGESLVVPADVADAVAITTAHAVIVATLGEVEILVNNAGWNMQNRHWRDLSVGSVQQLLATNLTGPFLMVLQVLPGMRARRSGVLIHIGSISATRHYLPAGPSYSASKHGARAMSASLNAEEGIHGIRSICIHPGEVSTPLLDRRPVPPSAADRQLMLQPEDVAAAIVFCATLPGRACVTELTIVPTDDEMYRAHAARLAAHA